LAGDQGFEPCRNGFGVRRSSCRVMPPVVRAAGLEPAREPGLSRPPLPIGLRAHGAGGRIRTDKHGGLSSADKPILVRRHNLVARPGFEPGKSLPSEGSAFTNLTSGPCVQDGIRTHRNSLLRTARLPIAPLGHSGGKCWSRTNLGARRPRAGLQPAAFAARPTSQTQ
jgi:hypothetical protein